MCSSSCVVCMRSLWQDVCSMMNYGKQNDTQTNTNNVNKTCALLQTTGGKDEQYVNAISILFFLLNR
jgi:hypothetical protein